VAELTGEENAARLGSDQAVLKQQPLTLPDLKAHLTFWPLVVVGFASDLWTKKVVFDYLKRQGTDSVPVIDGFLQLVIRLNKGAAFGIASGQTYLLIAISAIALVIILAIFLFGGIRQRLMHIALGLFAAGVCGNLYDRIFHNGFVRDFVDVVYWRGKHWPAFNLADSMLCVGVGLLILSNLLTGTSCQKHAPQQK
jgi:signal peptidase II